MKIAIDIKSALGDKTGKGVYAYNIVRELVKSGKEDEFLMYAPKSEDPFVDELAKLANVEVRVISSSGLKWHLDVYQDVMGLFSNGEVDAYFSPGSFIVSALFYWTGLLSFGFKKTPESYITVHDLVAFLYSDTHNKKAVFIEKLTLKSSLKGGKRIFAVSENTAKDVMSRFGIPSEKIIITYNAVGENFIAPNLSTIAAFREKYKLPKKYILSLGTLVPRKNIQLTLKAFSLLCADSKFSKDIDLCIVGGDGWGDSQEFALSEAAQNPRIHMLGYLPYEELSCIYTGAEVFVYPSLYEGFGIPPLEAASMSCPVIVSNTSSLPEVVGDSVMQIDPNDAEALAEAIKLLTSDIAKRKELIQKGGENIKRFSWRKSAERILKTIKL
ncbi:MAG: glycosyltransferase family 1 protein [Candidatus Peregrinibacteria bacterium]|nr:glycosyltransferase family 1 protein [Candidatus Peregrinibacteria bacterium]MDZ4244714.1 glycosyltransferase family 1 protein [Candidatus Gracilibacteria bacterium]